MVELSYPIRGKKLSLIERDLQRGFLELNPWMVGVSLIVLGPLAIWVIEVIRSQIDPSRPPMGIAVFRWTTVYIGDVFFLSGAMVAVAMFYERVAVNDDSLWTSRGFSIMTIALGIALSIAFIAVEEVTHAYPAELKINANRIWHFFYFAWVAGLLFGATRVIWYGIIEGHQRGLAWVAIALVALYFVTFALDSLQKNPVWPYVRKAYPNQTKNP